MNPCSRYYNLWFDYYFISGITLRWNSIIEKILPKLVWARLARTIAARSRGCCIETRKLSDGLLKRCIYMYMYIYFNRSLCLECRCVDTYVTEQKLHGCLKIALHLLCSTAHVIRYTELACIFICIYIYWSYTPTYICIDRYVCIYTLYVYVYLHCLMYLLSFYLVLFNVCTRLIHEVPFFFFFSFSVYVCLFVCVSVSYLFGFVFSVISGSRAKKLKNRFLPLSPLILSELHLVLSCFRGAQALFGFISAFFFEFQETGRKRSGQTKRNYLSMCSCFDSRKRSFFVAFLPVARGEDRYKVCVRR